MPPVGLRLRLMVPLAFVLIAYAAFQTYFTARTQRTEIFDEATLSTLRLANTVRRSTRQAMLQSRRTDVHEMIGQIGQQPGMDHVRIMNKEGKIVYSSTAEEIGKVVNRTAEGCFQCHDTNRPRTTIESKKRTRVFESPNGYRTLAAIDVIPNEPSCWSADCHAHTQQQTLLGVVDVGVSLKEADQRVARTTREAMLMGVLSTFVVCGSGAWLVHRLVNRPVQRLLECTQRVSNGDLSCSTDLASSDDEIGHLTRSFISMTADLQKAQEQLSSWAHRLEEEVERKTRDLTLAQAQVLRSEKLSSVGLLAAGVAHELNSPLTGILTFAHIVAKRLPESSSEREHVLVIATQAERCATIIRQLLDLSRERPPEKKRQDLHALIEQAVALVEHQPRFHDIRIQREYDSRIRALLMDAGQMQQVFLNLLVNGGEAMPQGGRLTIETRLESRPAQDAGDGQLADCVAIVVRDTGIGIAPEYLHRIFDPFFTLKDVGKGTGLGLAVTHGIVERHGGKITVESTVGQGTVFTIILPTGETRDTKLRDEA